MTGLIKAFLSGLTNNFSFYNTGDIRMVMVKKKTTRKIIFISSTYIDLKDERKKVWECLEKFDVQVKGMEQFGARKANPLETCLSEVEQSDIYVGIIGMRYGSEEPNSKKSYSQLEYETAVEQDKDILIYLIDEENSAVIPNLIQFEKMHKLNNFKSILKAKHTVDTFSNSQDLVTKLKRKFNELLTLKENEVIKDEYDNTKKILDRFFLVPAAYSGREIKLKVKFDQMPQPVSKSMCQNFNFQFGRTIINEIAVVHPKLRFQNFRHIFIGYDLFSTFINLDKSIEYEIFAKVLFKDEKAGSLTADFKDKIERIYNDWEDGPSDDYDPKWDEPYYEVLKEGEGQIALALTKIELKT